MITTPLGKNITSNSAGQLEHIDGYLFDVLDFSE